MGLLACRAGAASVVLLQREVVRDVRSRPAQAGAVDVVRALIRDLLAQKHSWEVLVLQEVKFEVLMLLKAALWVGC